MTAQPAAAYVRVSTEEQTEGWSLDGQEQQIRDYAEKQGYQIVRVYTDETSGSKEKRAGLDQMLMDAHAGLFVAIIAVHSSRFFRNVALARRYKDLLRNKLDIDVLFVNQPNLDPEDPMAFVMETFNELFDEYYLHQLRFWTSLGLKTRAQRGLWNGTLPFGYLKDPETEEPVPHPENAPGVQLAFEAYSTGNYTDRQIAELLNQHGYRTTGNWGERPFTKDTIRPLLMNQFYLGYVKYKGELYPGKHPSLIDEDLFKKCQAVRASKRSKRRAFGKKRRIYLLAGIARCQECGLTLRCYSTRSGNKWKYYRHTAAERGVECPAPGRHLREDILEPQWEEIVSRIVLPDDWRERIQTLAGDAGEREQLIREREMLEEKLRRLNLLYRDLMIGDGEYRQQRDQIRARLASLVVPDNPQVMEAGEYLQKLGPLWQAATLAEKRDITVLMLKSLYVDIVQETVVSIEPQPAFRPLLAQVCGDLGVEVR